MIKGSPRNMMMAADVVREVGTHTHVWLTVGVDSLMIAYRECKICGARSVLGMNRDRAKRQDWLAGDPWDAEPVPTKIEPVKAEADVAEGTGDTYTFTRRRGRPPKNR